MNRVIKNNRLINEKRIGKLKIAGYLSLAVIVMLAFSMQYYVNFSYKNAFLLLVVIEGAFWLIFSLFQNKLSWNTFWMILISGLFFVFLSPVLNAPDEPAHYARAMYVSEGHLGLSNDLNKLKISKDYRLVEKQSTQKQVFTNELFKKKHLKEKVSVALLTVTNTYSFIGYLPQAVGLFLGRVLHLSIAASFYLGRIFNLIVYDLLIAFAVKLAKGWEIPIMVTGMIPMSIYLGASYNQDGFSNGLIILSIAYFLFLISDQNEKITLKELLLFTLLCLVITTTKLPYIALGGLLIFIPRSRFQNRSTYWWTFGLVIFLIIGGLLWFTSYMEVTPSHRADYVHPEEQISYLIHHLPESIVIFLNGLINGIQTYNTMFTFGWLSYGLPQLGLVFLFYFGAVCLLFPVGESLPHKSKFGSALVSFAVILLIYASMYITWTAVGVKQIEGVQGRYFIGIFAMIPLVTNMVKSFGVDNFNILKITSEKRNKVELLFSGFSLFFVFSIICFTFAKYV